MSTHHNTPIMTGVSKRPGQKPIKDKTSIAIIDRLTGVKKTKESLQVLPNNITPTDCIIKINQPP